MKGRDWLRGPRLTVSDPNSFHRAIGPVLVFAQCFSILPVEGITARDATALRFRWLSWRIAYSAVCLAGTAFLLGIFTADLFRSFEDEPLRRASVVVYELVNALGMLMFVRLASKWPEVMRRVHQVELSMETKYGYPETLSKELRTISVVILSSALLEHVMASVQSVQLALTCGNKWAHAYFNHHFPIVFTSLMPFNAPMAAYLRLLSTVNVFAWNFMDLFIILISKMLSARLRQVNTQLGDAKRQGRVFWREAHRAHSRLSSLVWLVDDHLRPMVQLSCASDVLFVCVQLWHASRRRPSAEDAAYFAVSFVHLVGRTATMCVAAAYVREAARATAAALFSAPSDGISGDALTLLDHVVADPPTLASMTRGVALKLAGTIITYEVVLVQMIAEPSPTEDTKANTTQFCPS